MEYTAMGEGHYMLRFKQGEKLRTTFEKFLDKENIKSASFHGLGAFTEANIAYFDLKSKKYIECDPKPEGMFEVLSINGNVALKENSRERIIHMHTSISTTEYRGIGGHIVEATIGPTLEIHLQKFFKPLFRKYDPEIGLPLLNLENKI